MQDESDTNITVASPFKKMSDFIKLLAEKYPSYNFVVRPHPSGKPDDLPQLNNVKYQDIKVDIYKDLHKYGLVMGINSTLLLESVLLGIPVCAFGVGIGTGTGVFYELDKNNLPEDFSEISINSDLAKSYLSFLISDRQIHKKNLLSIKFLKRSYLGELLSLNE